MKSNVTLKLDRDLLRKARILAAEADTSISALLAQQLEKAVREREGYEQAKRQALANLAKGFHLGFTAPRSRDELHER
jgi:predicted transcriptional regulator